MKVAFVIGDKIHTVEAHPLDVVRLVASANNIGNVDVEEFPNKVTIKSDQGDATGKNLASACLEFFHRFSS